MILDKEAPQFSFEVARAEGFPGTEAQYTELERAQFALAEARANGPGSAAVAAFEEVERIGGEIAEGAHRGPRGSRANLDIRITSLEADIDVGEKAEADASEQIARQLRDMYGDRATASFETSFAGGARQLRVSVSYSG